MTKEERKAYLKEYKKAYHQRPEVKAHIKAYYKAYQQRPERKAYEKAYQKTYHKAYYQRPDRNAHVRAHMKEYYQRPERKAYLKEYYQRPERKAYYKEYYQRPEVKAYTKERKKTDPLFKLRCTLRSLIRNSMNRMGYTKHSRTHQILGCDYETFKQYIERQFTKGMTWDNMGKWHFDHIYPVSKAKSEEEIIRLNHYTNFQPLWAEENLSKGNKVIEKQLVCV
ncbi:MAG: hypothetical protein NUV80_00570 [Candidatus Berkelbacteria bacterium]|nr:hypothetical protein [Candidatus Berkelbacteria bacterium]